MEIWFREINKAQDNNANNITTKREKTNEEASIWSLLYSRSDVIVLAAETARPKILWYFYCPSWPISQRDHRDREIWTERGNWMNNRRKQIRKVELLGETKISNILYRLEIIIVPPYLSYGSAVLMSHQQNSMALNLKNPHYNCHVFIILLWFYFLLPLG